MHADQFSEKNFAMNIRNYIDLKLKEKVSCGKKVCEVFKISKTNFNNI